MMKNFILILIFLTPLLGGAQELKKSNEEIFSIVETMPEFPGGQEALFAYLAKHTEYPKKAKEKGISGKVYINFTIGKDGKIRDAKVIRGVHKLLDNEALRVVKAMPNWKPGSQKGKNVSVSYNLPLNFQLSKKNKRKGLKSN